MTNTATILINARVKRLLSALAGNGIRKYQTRKVVAAIAITAGTKMADI
jgi:hypothetical protein